ncbi:2'-5' RNA ligase family protein [Ideonella oryzae]|uniref:RNA 2',3'-cyclic phosphodiesterase n=1 Tax=Ideonella oryzae TaxID=2937441 RepID=A0ABT1BSK9_9BURK|nr:2'-5' RNA ligase family protein [Ideonella oryzae]MCO5979210.1 2'-5' RNA ligase family protein [Ideonella oryzae]
MSDQLSLMGFEAPPPAAPTDRLFFALQPTDAACAQIAALSQRLRESHGLNSKPIAPERLHITLHHLGDHAGVPADVVEAAGRAAARVVCAPFDVVLDHAMSFRIRRDKAPFVLRTAASHEAAVLDFQRQLGQSMALEGLGHSVDVRFTPHVTLTYAPRELPESPVEPVQWTVREFVLIHSLLGRTQHRVLARWPLSGAPQG